MNNIVITGIGCSLVDYLYSDIDFGSPVFKKYESKFIGDGGISPGRLVFTHEFEQLAKKRFSNILSELTGGKEPDSINIGGPGIVSLIHASQILADEHTEVKFFGFYGNDEAANYLLESLKKTPLNTESYQQREGLTPYTVVLSDPRYARGKGERAFINNIGIAWDFKPGNIDDSFFNSDIAVFGGTALVPNIHDKLHILLEKAKRNGCLTIVHTVYDFRNEKNNPGKPWPLGETEKSFPLIDLLIVDHEEALKISGTDAVKKASEYFIREKLPAFIITNGANNILLYSSGNIFPRLSLTEMPISKDISNDQLKYTRGDTTGCGDNFVGGVVAGTARQLKANKLNLEAVAALGIVSGGFACFYLGGTYFEKEAGEKWRKIKAYHEKYLKQIGK